MKVIDKIAELLPIRKDSMYRWTTLPTPNLINEAIISSLLTMVKCDEDTLVFCDLMMKLVDSLSSKEFIGALKTG